MYDVSGATDALYTNADHTAFSVLLNGGQVDARAIPGLELFDALLEANIPIAPYVPPAPPPITSVTPRQARLALLGAGLLDTVNSMIEGLSPADRITWDYATTIERTDPLIASLGAALELTEEQIDALFTNAASL